ncbi:putative SWI/SNF-related matrix-associated actin-dependent regulator of chromatin subfamily A member 3-like 3 [Senna tora]|uniref:Putative SWI/SNF-related matrix-associated actin-dependent regulator of chromatin subfamily A member 3-like 3 n=1 Tax=Senna tora TaxID=362788 RepID=A0A834W2L5_9FABA|nr:putative SWI/SNF-related matrix-associated actin-dependent regulator of chromatin subfamily A member 3-like 3 [Senna tora]
MRTIHCELYLAAGDGKLKSTISLSTNFLPLVVERAVTIFLPTKNQFGSSGKSPSSTFNTLSSVFSFFTREVITFVPVALRNSSHNFLLREELSDSTLTSSFTSFFRFNPSSGGFTTESSEADSFFTESWFSDSTLTSFFIFNPSTDCAAIESSELVSFFTESCFSDSTLPSSFTSLNGSGTFIPSNDCESSSISSSIIGAKTREPVLVTARTTVTGRAKNPGLSMRNFTAASASKPDSERARRTTGSGTSNPSRDRTFSIVSPSPIGSASITHSDQIQ